jgi:hypothetical protein
MSSKELEDLKAELEAMKEKVQLLEDSEAIRRLKARYAQACDDKYNLDKLGELFAEDAVWDGGELMGTHNGKAAVLKFFKEIQNSITFGVHYFLMPHLTIEGNKAQARWYVWMPATFAGNRAGWIAGFEDDRYVKTKGQWYVTYMKMNTLFQTPYEMGWHKSTSMD